MRRTFTYIPLLLALTLILSACRAFEQVDIPGTQVSENTAYQTEIAALAVTAVQEQATTAAEVAAAATESAALFGVNRQLVGTLQAVVTPTLVLIEDDSIELASLPSSVQGITLYAATGMTDAVDSSGCITVRRLEFSPGQRMYATIVLYNIAAGTNMTIEWSRDGELVYSDGWTAPENSSYQCLWFSLDSSRARIDPGRWRVLVYADGFPAINPLDFTVTGG
jgi:hypothetical protein